MKLPWTMGIEVTGVPPIPFDVPRKVRRDVPWFDIGTNRYIRQSRLLSVSNYPRIQKNEVIMKRVCGKTAHVDMHCMEVPSPIFRDTVKMRKWFLDTREKLAKHCYFPKHPDVVDGGGHIHVGLRGKFACKVVADIKGRPYLPWIFSEADECDSCDNDYLGSFDWGKGKAVRHTGFGTIEFRFFEAASDWDEQWDHIDFVLHYLKYLKRCNPKPGEILAYDELQNISCQEVISSFRKLLGDIGLPYERYEKYVIRNLLPRWELGRERR